MIQSAQAATIPVTPLVLSDRLLTLAQLADRAGCRTTATALLSLAHAVFDDAPGYDRILAAAA